MNILEPVAQGEVKPAHLDQVQSLTHMSNFCLCPIFVFAKRCPVARPMSLRGCINLAKFGIGPPPTAPGVPVLS